MLFCVSSNWTGDIRIIRNVSYLTDFIYNPQSVSGHVQDCSLVLALTLLQKRWNCTLKID